MVAIVMDCDYMILQSPREVCICMGANGPGLISKSLQCSTYLLHSVNFNHSFKILPSSSNNNALILLIKEQLSGIPVY